MKSQGQRLDLLHQVHQRHTTNLAILPKEVPLGDQSFCHADESLLVLIQQEERSDELRVTQGFSDQEVVHGLSILTAEAEVLLAGRCSSFCRSFRTPFVWSNSMVVQLIANSRAGPRSLPTNFVAQYLRFSTAVPRTYQQTSLVYLPHVPALPSHEGIVCSFSEASLGPVRFQVLSPESAANGCQRSRPKSPW